MAETILYVDDEEHYRRLVRLFLEREGYEVLVAADGEEALELLGKRPDPCLAILDVMMPRKDGYETCRCIRSFSTMPVLMLTALGDEIHEIRGMEGGADDYLSKPFSRDLLLAHVRALLRRGKVELPGRIEAGGILLDLDARLATCWGKALDLSFREFELLLHLMRNAGTVCPRERILDRVWGYSYSGDPRTLDTHIKSLRRKLGPAGALIVTVRGLGYSFREGGA
jgi:DNA-binding response OmpR family regulator